MRQPAKGDPIPNINFGRTFNLRYEDEEIHCESLGKLANFFGRNMPAHRHDQVFQIHLLMHGEIRLHLDDHFYHIKAPLVFVTPPAVTHAFIISDEAAGQVLSVRQQLIWRLFKSDPSGILESSLNRPHCIELDNAAPDKAGIVAQLLQYMALLGAEFGASSVGRELNLQALTRLAFVAIGRLAAQVVPAPGKRLRTVDVQVFRDFNELIEQHFREHWPLGRYAKQLSLTEARLNDICRRIADMPSKQLVHDRLLREAKRQLLFSAVSVSGIGYDLGFKDGSYFSRFFRQQTSLPPGEWREQTRSRGS